MPIFLLSFFLFHYTADDDNKDKVEVSRDFKENVIEPILKVIREEILECIYGCACIPTVKKHALISEGVLIFECFVQ